MSTGTDRSRTGPLVHFGAIVCASPGRVVWKTPVFGSRDAQLLDPSESETAAGEFPSAMKLPSVVHRMRHPIAIGYIFGAASSFAPDALASAGTLIVPGCAIARAIDIPLDANDDVRTVAVSSPVRRATFCHISGGMLSASRGLTT